MDYNKLAELLFPNLKHDYKYYEKKYQNRELKEGQEVVRFAPSPTGFVHLGNFFSAYIDFLIAKESNGVFYVRLEDTDEKRRVDGAEEVLFSILRYYGIKHTEGFMYNSPEAGDYGPYVQSKRGEIYQAYTKRLVQEGKAFPCFCDATEGGKKEIIERRKQELEEEDTIKEKDLACRKLTYAEIKKNIENGKSFAIRLKSEGDPKNKIKFIDMRGEREISENGKDIVILKSDGIPPYVFAHIVDDHLMKTTIVVRDQGYYSSVAQHLEVAKAMGTEGEFKYLHTPLLSKIDEKTGNKRKVSKRYDPEANMTFFETNGYPKEAVLEYLLTLINSNFEMWRIENPQSKLEEFPFSISKIGTSDPMVDMTKFNDISKIIISKMSAMQVYDLCREWAIKHNKLFTEYLTENRGYCTSVFNIEREKDNPRKDIYNWSQLVEYYDYMWSAPTVDKQQLQKFSIELIYRIMDNYTTTFLSTDDKDTWFAKIKVIAAENNFAVNNKEYKANKEKFEGNLADLCNIIRIILTNRAQTPDLYEICKILGEKEILKRIKAFKK